MCQPGQTPAICGGTIVPCTTTDGDPGVCLTTTGQAGYCATVTVGVACQKDAKCRAFTMNPRAACTRCATAPAGAVCALF